MELEASTPMAQIWRRQKAQAWTYMEPLGPGAEGVQVEVSQVRLVSAIKAYSCTQGPDSKVL